MSYFRKMYFTASAAIAEALESLDELNIGEAKETLRKAQLHTEEIYMREGGDEDEVPKDETPEDSSDGAAGRPSVGPSL